MHLKIELYRFKSLLYGSVLEQWGIERGCGDIVMKPFLIGSYAEPELDRSGLFIRGEQEEEDNRIFFFDFTTEEAAIKASENILAAVAKVNGEKSEDHLVVKLA